MNPGIKPGTIAHREVQELGRYALATTPRLELVRLGVPVTVIAATDYLSLGKAGLASFPVANSALRIIGQYA